MLDCIEIEPSAETRASVIWLHGLGANGRDFVPVVDELGLADDHRIRFVFPNASARPVTVNGGMRMPAWYDITGPDIADRQDADGIAESTVEIERLIEREAERGISADRIVLAGFSQGGAIALHAGVRRAAPLAGIMALSTYLPLAERLDNEHAPASRARPIFMAHGENDTVVPTILGERSRDALRAAGFTVAWHAYPMAHEVCMPEIQAIGGWLDERLTD